MHEMCELKNDIGYYIIKQIYAQASYAEDLSNIIPCMCPYAFFLRIIGGRCTLGTTRWPQNYIYMAICICR